jgi:pimeloyl-ACP methyl ester carboxylesterase
MLVVPVMAKRTVDLSQGAVEYEDVGAGPPVVLLHGLLVDASLWRDVVPRLAREARVVVPELPLGCHRLPLPADAPLAPPDVARLVAELLIALDLQDVTLVGNDTGGAIAQLVAANHPERIGRLVLTPCDLYENFLPPLFRPLQLLARVPIVFGAAMQTMRVPALRRSPSAYGWLMRRFDAERVDGWVRAMLALRGARRDAAKVLRGIDKRQTLDAAERLRTLGLPLLLAWAPADRSFKLRYAERMAAEVPGARLERIEDAFTFVPVDQPERTAQLIAGFVRESTRAAA